jgi:hypothetical protein
VTTGVLLEHGARIAGTNAMYKVLDDENVAALELLLRHGGNPNEPARNAPLTDCGSPLMWAIRRRRSRKCITTLLDAGADPRSLARQIVDYLRAVLLVQMGNSSQVEAPFTRHR